MNLIAKIFAPHYTINSFVQELRPQIIDCIKVNFDYPFDEASIMPVNKAQNLWSITPPDDSFDNYYRMEIDPEGTIFIRHQGRFGVVVNHIRIVRKEFEDIIEQHGFAEAFDRLTFALRPEHDDPCPDIYDVAEMLVRGSSWDGMPAIARDLGTVVNHVLNEVADMGEEDLFGLVERTCKTEGSTGIEIIMQHITSVDAAKRVLRELVARKIADRQ